ALSLRSEQRGRQVFAVCFTLEPNLRLPVRILIMLPDVTRQGLRIVVEKRMLEPPDSARCIPIDDNMLVNFHIGHGCVLVFETAFKMAFPSSEERKLVEVRSAVPQFPAQKEHAKG